MARTVIAHLFNSVNGVVESPDQWQLDSFGPDDMAAMGEAIAGITDVVIGRVLWQEWAGYWPTADDPFAQFINPVRKHVISTTLDDVSAWQGSSLVEGDPVEFVRSLADNGEQGSVSVAGGIDTVRSLFLAGVIDELTLNTHPVVGAGRRLFDDTVPITRLELVSTRPTSTGNVYLTYRLRP
ncbi:dihydrofolate reductase family protein [Ornithinimicrobium tianjinense]|uniref:Deaminase reductase n=1 Tax=Ornithinimicrobium tianjinense TaxID=1195761 RepID=A0A917F1P2_9MICO|nr:dihydrofolate reductase family protein [Ornithinimicrobium tianjinense]GGF43967.1 deaminase reductase [Ornithinimicrobium tianjinense]